MVLHVLRALFVLLMAAAGWHYLLFPAKVQNEYNYLAFFVTLCVGVFFVCVDILSPRKKLVIFSGTFFGLLVGMAITYALSYIVLFVVDVFLPKIEPTTSAQAFAQTANRNALINFINLIIGIVVCYLAISFVLQTKDDFRFIVPYVEFSKQIRGARAILVDTSVIIDGRILDLADTGILESRLIVPRFVVEELQTIADMGDRLKRNRGRRGLDILAKLQGNPKVEVILFESGGPSGPGERGSRSEASGLGQGAQCAGVDQRCQSEQGGSSAGDRRDQYQPDRQRPAAGGSAGRADDGAFGEARRGAVAGDWLFG
ncbi:MAG TPA: PIN/TRAM domain-containing protein [Tepidisphaeraceae bacterium]|nr:PIN/TRAM domain-containing protein [Tepidisphaeraceae bacterium]